MGLTAKTPNKHIVDSFGFLQDYLDFLPTGLPTDPSTYSYYKRRSQIQHSPEVISFSVFLHAICNCFIPTTDYIRLSNLDKKYQPEWISEFWHDIPPITLNPITQTHDVSSAFSCDIFDLRQCKPIPPSVLNNLPRTKSAQAVIFLITDELPSTSTATVTQQTPFGVISFFNKEEWEMYCENIL